MWNITRCHEHDWTCPECQDEADREETERDREEQERNETDEKDKAETAGASRQETKPAPESLGINGI